jgi:phage baseplate assembly protein gpV/phage protein D
MNAIEPLPQLLIELDGAELDAGDARALCGALVRQRLSLPSLCELRFFDPAGPLGRAAAPPAGAALRVSVRGRPTPLFVGEATALEYHYGPSGGREVRVRGYDVLHRLRKRQPVRAHVGPTLQGLAEDLAGPVGLTVEGGEDGPRWRRLIQHRQPDLDLLAEAAERCGYYFTARGDVLHLLTLEGIGEPLPLALGDSLLEARLEVNGDPACRSAATEGWDPATVEARRGRADRPRVGRDAAAEAPPDLVGGAGEWTLTGEAVDDDAQAEALAQAELDRRSARETTVWGVARGDPELRPGAVVEVAGVGSALTGRYVVASAVHTLDARSGYLTEIDSAPPPPRPRPAAAVAAWGVVTGVDDPQAIGRVRVSLPAYGDVETEWMPVVAAGAGAGKGAMLLPDVGDQVLVLFLQEDAARGVVLGGLYGAKGPPDAGLEGGGVRRYTFLTPGGQRVRLDDGRGAVRVENADGSYLEMSPEAVRLHAQRDLHIEAPGRKVFVRGQTIDFERA